MERQGGQKDKRGHWRVLEETKDGVHQCGSEICWLWFVRGYWSVLSGKVEIAYKSVPYCPNCEEKPHLF